MICLYVKVQKTGIVYHPQRIKVSIGLSQVTDRITLVKDINKSGLNLPLLVVRFYAPSNQANFMQKDNDNALNKVINF